MSEVMPGRPKGLTCSALLFVSLLSVFAISASVSNASPSISRESKMPELDLGDVGSFLQWLKHDQSGSARRLRRAVKSGPADLKRELRLARRAGIPVTWKELRPRDLTPATNAVTDYARIPKLMQTLPMDVQISLGGFGPKGKFTESQLAAARRALFTHPGILETLRRATSKRFSQREHDGLDLDYDSTFSDMREAMRVVSDLSYVLHWTQGQHLQAVEDQGLMMAMADQLLRDSGILSTVTARLLEFVAFNNCRQYLQLADGNLDLALAVRRLASHRAAYSIRRAVFAQGCSASSLLDTVRYKNPERWGHAVGRYGEKPKVLSAAQQRFVNGLVDATEALVWNRVRRLAATSDTAVVETSKKARRSFDAIALEPAGLPLPKPLSDVVDFSTLSSGLSSMRAAELRRRTVAAAAEVLIYRAKSGRFPTSLEQALSRRNTRFEGLKYRVTARGFTISAEGRLGRYSDNLQRLTFENYVTQFQYSIPERSAPANAPTMKPG